MLLWRRGAKPYELRLGWVDRQTVLLESPRNDLHYAVGIPLVAVTVAGVFAIGLAQVLLTAEGTLAVVLFSLAAALVLGGAALIAYRPWERDGDGATG